MLAHFASALRRRKSAPTLLRLGAALLFLSVLSTSVQAQVLITTPNCGPPGASVLITGSGWAEPDPPCDYFFFFDGVEVAPPQPDGLFGPPNTVFTVPAGAADGDHVVQVKLILFDGTELQCRETCFRVVQTNADPWDSNNNISVTGASISVDFDPEDVCDVTPCEKLVMVQTVTNIGELADGSTRFLSYAEYNTNAFGDPALRDADVINGRTVDYVPGEADPYYNGDDAPDGVQQGVQNCDMPMSSIISDGPGCGDSCYPADIVKIIWDFEVGVFCAEGHDAGQWVGSMTWRWERPLGGNATVTFLSSSRNAPSAAFMAALALWNTNHGFTLPTSGTAQTGGDPCSN